MKYLLLLPVFAFALSVSSCRKIKCDNLPSHSCGDFETQGEAQRQFDKCPEKYRDMDDDNDGKACEVLP